MYCLVAQRVTRCIHVAMMIIVLMETYAITAFLFGDHSSVYGCDDTGNGVSKERKPERVGGRGPETDLH